MARLMEARGFVATGLNEILRESATPRGSLYYHFPGGKEELAIAAIRETATNMAERTRAMLFGRDPAVAIESFISEVARHVTETAGQAGGPIAAVAIESSSTSPRLSEECRLAYVKLREAFQEPLEREGIAAERAEELAIVIVAAVEGAIILARIERGPRVMHLVGRELAALVSHELLAARAKNRGAAM